MCRVIGDRSIKATSQRHQSTLKETELLTREEKTTTFPYPRDVPIHRIVKPIPVLQYLHVDMQEPQKNPQSFIHSTGIPSHDWYGICTTNCIPWALFYCSPSSIQVPSRPRHLLEETKSCKYVVPGWGSLSWGSAVRIGEEGVREIAGLLNVPDALCQIIVPISVPGQIDLIYCYIK